MTATRLGNARRIIGDLFAHTGRHQLSNTTLAQTLGIHPATITDWHTGHYLPSYTTALAWADLFELRLAVIDHNDQILAEGADVPGKLRELRERAGLSRKVVAARLGVSPSNVTIRELSTRSIFLSTVAGFVAALGYRLTLLEVTR